MSGYAWTARWWMPVVLVVAACSPSLNWRNTSLGSLVFSLPCKPDKAQRVVTLAGRQVPLEMQGCEAGGALFAISRLQVDDATAVPDVLQAWRSSALLALRADDATARSVPAPRLSGVPGLATAPWLQASGLRPQGGAVQGQLAWLVLGRDVYHLAVYADSLGADMIEPFFTDISVP